VKWPDRVENVIGQICRVFSSIGMVFLILLMLIITADIVLRATLNQPIRGADEIAQLMMLIVVFLAVAFTQYKKAHIAVDLLHSRFPQKARAIVDSFTCLLSLGICGLIAWQSLAYVNRLADLNKVSDILMIPLAPFEVIVFVGFLLFGLVLLVDFLRSLGRVARP